jgi:polyphosphate kinase
MAVHLAELGIHSAEDLPVAAGTSPVTVAPVTAAIKVPPAAKPSRNVPLFNREFSWLEFNRRVLAEAEDPSVPILERLKFLAIASSNLDEFFMVRVSGVRDMVIASLAERSPDGLTARQQLKGIRERTSRLLLDMYACLNEEVLPELNRHGIRIDSAGDLSKRENAALRDHFHRNLAPILTPLAIDPGHPFPFLANLALNLAVKLESDRGEGHVVFVKVPPQIPRLVPVPEADHRYIPLEELIATHAGEFFPSLKVHKVTAFRVIRNSDLSIREDEVEDLLKSVETELQRRDRKEVVRIELGSNGDEDLIDLLTSETHCAREDVFVAPGILKIADLMQIYSAMRKHSLKDEPFNPRIASQLAISEDIFSIIRREDILLHRPYDSFTSAVEFVQAASEDPDVLAIKMTLYRVDSNSPITAALAKAALAGKQVTAVVELQARFDEKRNIAWAKQLEQVGVQVVYGLVGIKTHCKICVIVRREGETLRRYVHLSTGNYNATTGRLYTDIDLFTCDEAFGDDASQMMNLLTGFSISTVQQIFDGDVPELTWKRLVIAPMDYRQWVIDQIEREIRNAGEGKPSGIIAKMNSLVEPGVIEALYRASQAGVKIDLIVRGICCLVPGVEGLSERISVTAVIDRFLEHSRIFLFRNGKEPEIWLSSGDWMPRNFVRRFEATFPVLDPRLKTRIENEILQIQLDDNVKGWTLNTDGSYTRRAPSGNKAVRSQERFIEIARKEAMRLAPYDEILTMAGSARRKAKKQRKKDRK